jgi:hypothetical protein
MTKRSIRSVSAILATLAVPAGLAIAPSLAGAKVKTALFQGPINLAKNPGFVPVKPGQPPGSSGCCFREFTPTMQLSVRFDGKKVTNLSLTEIGMWGPCSGYGESDGESEHEFKGGLKPKKNGTFSGTHTDGSGSTLTVTGKIPRKGTPTGTVQEVRVIPQTPGSGSTFGTCDSGVVTWSATRTNNLSKPSDL